MTRELRRIYFNVQELADAIGGFRKVDSKFLPPHDELHWLVMEIEITLPKVEGIAHVCRCITEWKSQRVRVYKLGIESQPIRWNYLHAAPNTGKLIQTVFA